MNELTSAFYMIFGLLVVTLTYFENYSGPAFITFLGAVLFLYGLLGSYFKEFMKSHNRYWNEDHKD